MYLIKDVIVKMKKIAGVDSNIELSKYLNISYNTLNTWIKRGKLPQETILSFCEQNNCSLDYLLLNKNANLFDEKKETNTNTIQSTQKMEYFKFYAEYDKLNISYGTTLKLSPTLYISNGYYLIKKDNVITIAKCFIDIFSKNVTLYTEETKKILTFDEFRTINLGLITI